MFWPDGSPGILNTMRINGIGTTLLGIGPLNPENRAMATLWFTFVFLPVCPLRRYYLTFLPPQGNGFTYRILERRRLDPWDVFKTYVFGWLVYPTLVFWPFPIAVIEVWEALGLPARLHIPFVVVTIIWMIGAVNVLHILHYRRGEPRSPSARPRG
ncbi:MAG: hypothetical protein O3C67_06950 [Cyanobacteria bacterium]|nr:hypothetical protein [Cyanobacteriota bacterium]MEB3268440.1 hypothetical protein [Leptolyngbya sp.]